MFWESIFKRSKEVHFRVTPLKEPCLERDDLRDVKDLTFGKWRLLQHLRCNNSLHPNH